MKSIDNRITDSEVFGWMRRTAATGTYDGVGMGSYFESCQWWWERYGCTMVFTRDVGHHTSGWWKNPDYERCFHLSVSFPGGKNKKALEKLLAGLFGTNRKLLWVEPPYSVLGIRAQVWHYRLFCDEHWQPIKPRGEVYSTRFTEKGWKSFSEIHGRRPFGK